MARKVFGFVLEEELHRKAMAKAVRQGKKLSDIVQKLLEKWVNGEVEV